MKHWRVQYYFTCGGKKRLYKGVVCECFHADSAKQAIALANITQDEMSEGNTLKRVSAIPQTNRGLCNSSQV